MIQMERLSVHTEPSLRALVSRLNLSSVPLKLNEPEGQLKE